MASPKARVIGLRTEDGDAAVLLAVCLEALEDGLRVVKDRGARVDRDRSVGTHLRISPAAPPLPGRAGHVFAEDLAESGIGKDARAFPCRHPRGRGRDLKSHPDGSLHADKSDGNKLEAE